MEFNIHPKILPLVKDLHNLQVDTFLASNDFERILAKLEALEDWQKMCANDIQFRNFHNTAFINYSIREKAFAAFLGEGLENAEADEFNEILFEILEEFISFKKVFKYKFSAIEKDLIVLNFPQEKIEQLNSKLIGISSEEPNTKDNDLIKNEPQEKQRVKKLFISHSSKDKTIIDSFIQKIMLLGLEIDRNDIFCSSIEGLGIRTGDDFRDKIKEEITTSEIVIIMLSEHYKKSEICQNEMGAAWVLSKKVIPIMIPPFNYDDVGALRSTEHIDRIDSNGGVDNIIHALKDLLDISIKDMRFINKQRDEFLNSFKIQNNGAERVNDQIKKTFRIDDPNAITIIFHIGSYKDGIHRTQERLEKLTGFDATKIDTIVNSYPDILRRSRSSSGKTIYRLQDSAKLKFDENIKL